MSLTVGEEEAVKEGKMGLTSLFFHQNYGGYNAGERAGFTPKRTEKLLTLERDGMPICEKVSDIEARKAKAMAKAPATKVVKSYAKK